MYIQPSIPPSVQQYNDLLYNKYGIVSCDRIKRIASPADKDRYTAHDALVDEYLSQFKIQCHLSFSSLTIMTKAHLLGFLRRILQPKTWIPLKKH